MYNRKLVNFWQRFLNFLDERIHTFGAQYKLFGLFVLVDTPLNYLLNHSFGNPISDNFLIRTISLLLSFPLIFSEKLPFKFKRYLNFYWFATLTYDIPFLCAYMTLLNHFSSQWLLEWALALLWLILMVDSTMFIISLAIGIVTGVLIFIGLGNEIIIQKDLSPLPILNYLYLFFYIVVIGYLFAKNKERLENERLQAIKMVGGTIAHEMRTPLLIIQTVANGLQDFLPELVGGYEKAREAKLVDGKRIRKHIIPVLRKGALTIEKVTRNCFNIIDMLLMNIQENPPGQDITRCSISKCVEEAVKTYSFADQQRDLVIINIEQDFDFYGVQRLMVHVFFNLIKNAVYYIQAAGKGNITIWTEITEKANILHFKDTGKGISKDILPNIFKRFYGKTRNGTGIGLAFCYIVMQNLEGKIICDSIEGEFTTFSLFFPKIEE